MKAYGLNNAEVLQNINNLLDKAKEYKKTYGRNKKYLIDNVYEELSIFDWWSEELSVTQLKQMKSFLKNASKLGYNGYVCFKVGAVGCANGMWAHKNESTNGYSPDGEVLYHSFVRNENYWDCELPNGKWLSTHDKYRFTLKEIKEAFKEYNN